MGRIILKEAKARMSEKRLSMRKKGSLSYDEYRSAEARALKGAYTIMTRGTRAQLFFEKGRNSMQEMVDNGSCDDWKFEKVVEGLRDEIVLAHLMSNNRQDDDTVSVLAESVKYEVEEGTIDKIDVVNNGMSVI